MKFYTFRPPPPPHLFIYSFEWLWKCYNPIHSITQNIIVCIKCHRERLPVENAIRAFRPTHNICNRKSFTHSWFFLFFCSENEIDWLSVSKRTIVMSRESHLCSNYRVKNERKKKEEKRILFYAPSKLLCISTCVMWGRKCENGNHFSWLNYIVCDGVTHVMFIIQIDACLSV